METGLKYQRLMRGMTSLGAQLGRVKEKKILCDHQSVLYSAVWCTHLCVICFFKVVTHENMSCSWISLLTEGYCQKRNWCLYLCFQWISASVVVESWCKMVSLERNFWNLKNRHQNLMCALKQHMVFYIKEK